jgi:hypothetical protein
MFAHVFEMARDKIFVVIWGDKSRKAKIEQKEFTSRDTAIDWLWDECQHDILSLKTEWKH